jgi:hypothetical protein
MAWNGFLVYRVIFIRRIRGRASERSRLLISQGYHDERTENYGVRTKRLLVRKRALFKKRGMPALGAVDVDG